MVHEEHSCVARRLAPEARPLHTTGAPPLLRPILGDLCPAVTQQRPGLLPVSNGDRVVADDRAVTARQSGIAQHALRALALLEAHEVVGLAPPASRDELAGAAAVSVAELHPE